MRQYSDKDLEQIRDLQYLVTCRQAIASNLDDQRNLDKQLNEKDTRNKNVLPEGSPERAVVEAKLQGKQAFYNAVMTDLQKYDIHGFHGLNKRIEDTKQKYPEQADLLEGIKANYNAWHSGQSDQGQQGQQGQTTQVQTLSSGKVQDSGYHDVFNNPPAQPKGQTSQSGQQSAYDKAFETPQKPSADPVMKQQEKDK